MVPVKIAVTKITTSPIPMSKEGGTMEETLNRLKAETQQMREMVAQSTTLETAQAMAIRMINLVDTVVELLVKQSVK